MKVRGWVLDIFALDKLDGVVLWVIGEDGKRYRFKHSFSITFYASGSDTELRSLWKYLRLQPEPLSLKSAERRDLFDGYIRVLACEVCRPLDLPGLFSRVSQSFPNLTFYDCDIHIALRYTAAFEVFPLAYCEIEANAEKQIIAIHPLDTRWEIDPIPAPVRILELKPDIDPSQGTTPENLILSYKGIHGNINRCLPFANSKALIVDLFSTLKQYDPDIFLTSWGDKWLLPYLLKESKSNNWPLPLNREPTSEVKIHKDVTYFSYGQIVYRGQQISLQGRLHIDRENTMLWDDYDLEGIFESARVTGLPIQDAARLSPGTGISSMQFITAIQNEILVPYHKHMAEAPKDAIELIQDDMGGLICQPIIGLHKEAASIDYTSLYPSIIVKYNISPEIPRAEDGLNPVTHELGIIPKTIKPLLDKRIILKSRLASLGKNDVRRKPYEAKASSEKWLLLTSSGYLGYKNARFGGVENHEILTECGREALLLAKEISEELGFSFLHGYVDGLVIQKKNFNKPEQFQELLDLIEKESGIPITLEGVYKWVAFLPSKRDDEIPVSNRYFGVFLDGTSKMRGIEARRSDTPSFIAEMQREMLDTLARAANVENLPEYVPIVSNIADKTINALKQNNIPQEDLMISTKLSHEIDDYKVPSRGARAAMQLIESGRDISAGQRIRYVLTRGKSGVYAWGMSNFFDERTLDKESYKKLIIRARDTILQPFARIAKLDRTYQLDLGID